MSELPRDVPDRAEQTESDPYRVLPPRLSALLEEVVLVPEGSVLAGVPLDSVAFLTAEWRRLLDNPREIEKWIKRYAGRAFALDYAKDGTMVPAQDAEDTKMPGSRVPERLVSLLVDEGIKQPLNESFDRWTEVALLVAEWQRIHTDAEKVIGHLIRAHGVVGLTHDSDHGDMIRRHADLHAAARREDRFAHPGA